MNIIKRLSLIVFATLTFVCLCNKSFSQTNRHKTDISAFVNEKESAEYLDAFDWDVNDFPMPMYEVNYYDDDYNVTSVRLRHLFDNENQREYFTSRASKYKTMVLADKIMKIAYKGYHKGPEMGNLIGGMYEDLMSGLDYDCEGEWSSGFAFTDNFMKTHDVVYVTEDLSEAPKSVVDSLQARYGLVVKNIRKCAVSQDGKLVVYSGQMMPKDGKCLGMRVLKIEDKLLVFEDWAAWVDEYSVWNVDDEGEYISIYVLAVTRSDKGYDIFYCKGAPESLRHGVLMVRGDKIIDFTFSNFYNYIDYQPSTEE